MPEWPLQEPNGHAMEEGIPEAYHFRPLTAREHLTEIRRAQCPVCWSPRDEACYSGMGDTMIYLDGEPYHPERETRAERVVGL